jgi:heme/copper-type cytochrome/quinol oxidase subunit 4
LHYGHWHGPAWPASVGRPQALVLEAAAMSDFLSQYLVPIAIVAVAIVLLLGLVNMMRGGSPDRSQKLMRLRVLLQFVAIVVIMAAIWVMGR